MRLPNNFFPFLRVAAATLISLSGLGQIASLWLRELTGAAIADAMLGTVYLIIGIGLFGHSRFSLFLGILIPTTATVVLLFPQPQPEQIVILRITVDIIVALLSAIILWRVRNNPSV